MYTAGQICRMADVLVDIIFVKFGGCLFRQVIVLHCWLTYFFTHVKVHVTLIVATAMRLARSF